MMIFFGHNILELRRSVSLYLIYYNLCRERIVSNKMWTEQMLIRIIQEKKNISQSCVFCSHWYRLEREEKTMISLPYTGYSHLVSHPHEVQTPLDRALIKFPTRRGAVIVVQRFHAEHKNLFLKISKTTTMKKQKTKSRSPHMVITSEPLIVTYRWRDRNRLIALLHGVLDW